MAVNELFTSLIGNPVEIRSGNAAVIGDEILVIHCLVISGMGRKEK